ncbi:MAG: ion transporter, partial [Verrucomicrobia bacterium]|nr:ion transporter [Verrucomicrobiota bacterium]
MNSDQKRQLHEIIFEADTPAGKLFDILLIVAIVSSAGVVILESISSFRANHASALRAWEWFFTILFTVEYALRVACVGRPSRYIFSFYGMVDLLAILPTYLGAFLPGSRYLVTIRMLRLLRIFRVLKLVKYVADASEINRALAASRRKIFVFLYTVLTRISHTFPTTNTDSSVRLDRNRAS